MKHEVRHGPSFSSLFLTLEGGEQVRTEAGAMVGMSPNFDISTKAYGGFFKALIRRLLGGESVFQNTYTAKDAGSELILSPTVPGEILHRKIEKGKSFVMQGSAFLASSPSVELKTKYGGVSSMMSGEGLFLLEIKGEGDLWYNSYGKIIEIDVQGGYVVDTGHIVAFEDTLKFKVKRVGGLKSTLLSGEGFVAEFSGNGKLYIQSRTVSSLIGWLTPMLPMR
ncbi:MAG: TIGR00266 family protein [Deltaproteobacteria bacterium]|nr:TIGR00266 family protein [Deltaproteobacteria bacterium]